MSKNMPKNNKLIKNVHLHMNLTDERLLTVMIQAKMSTHATK